MSAMASVASWLLGAAFVLAGASKLAIGRAWPVQARLLGSPRWVAIAVPWFELAIGAALIVQIVEPWPAVAAIVMLTVFSTAIVRLLLQGQHPVCACFGAWSAKPIGLGHLLRNAALLALAIVTLLA